MESLCFGERISKASCQRAMDDNFFSWKFTSQYFACNDTIPRQFKESNQHRQTPDGRKGKRKEKKSGRYINESKICFTCSNEQKWVLNKRLKPCTARSVGEDSHAINFISCEHERSPSLPTIAA
uniref:Uncharacterized protein n=1 Tax=Salix viminalis TaxID=40686 RepID=A0A6N2MRQ7_SALVM